MVHALVLACGNVAINTEFPWLTHRDDVTVRELPALPGKSAVDPLLEQLNGARLVVVGRDADLAAVTLRILRTERLGEVELGYLPAQRTSQVARLLGLPVAGQRAFELAATGATVPTPLVRDDTGGVLVGLGVISPVEGVAYCDDTNVLRGAASRLEVTPDPAGGEGLRVRVVRRGLLGRRSTVTAGRAVQFGGELVTVVRDGVPHPRELDKWIWYRHTEDLRLARPAR